jgi:hypothetical protein
MEVIKMKKLLALLLALLMMLMMVSCDFEDLFNGKDDDDDKKSTSQKDKDDDDDDEEEEDKKDTVDKTDKVENKDISELTRGELDEDLYTNKFLEIKFNKPEDWEYATDSEVAELVGMSAEMIYGDVFNETLLENLSVYDMLAKDAATGTNVMVGYENLAKTLSTKTTVEQYVDALERQMGTVSGMKVSFPDEYEDVKLGEIEFTKVACKTTMQGVTMDQVYYLKKVDGYMCFVIITVRTGYTVAEVEAMFE